MVFNFKKIASVTTSGLMMVGTVALAAAANYPAPFVQNGHADVAIVVGESAASSDLSSATALTSDLATTFAAQGGQSTGVSTTVEGDHVQIQKASTKFHLGNGIRDVVSGTLTDTDLSTLLAEGTYLDNDNDEFDYTQKIVLGNSTVSLFDDNDYAEDEPTVGMRIGSGDFVFNYTLDFSDDPLWADLEESDIQIMGKNYYILSTTTNTTINLLDASTEAVVREGESQSVVAGGQTYSISADFIGSGSTPTARLIVNGQTTNTLREGQTYKLSDGSYIGIRDIDVQDYAGGIRQVRFSIGSGKIELRHGQDIKLGEDSVSGLSAWFSNSGEALQSITLTWRADDDLFVTESSSVALPGFENIKFSYTGMTFPSEEMFTVEKGGNTYLQLNNFPLKTSTETIPLLYGDGTQFTGVGKDSTHKLVTANSTTSSITFDGDTDDMFVVTFDDATSAESYLMRANGFISDNGVNKTDIQYRSDGSWTTKKSDAKATDTIDLGSVSLTIGQIDKDAKTVIVTAGSNVKFDRIATEEGLIMYLPWTYSSANYTSTGARLDGLQTNSSAEGYSASTFKLRFFEEDKNDNPRQGNNFNATAGWTSDKTTISSVSGAQGGYEVGDSDNMLYYVYSALATELLHKTGGDQDSVDITYHGSESFANVFVSEAGAVTSSGGSSALGNIVVTDNQVATVGSKNLVVVGGSCINKVASRLLTGADSAVCGADFTTRTGVGTGSYLIQSFQSPWSSSKVAVLVAGYTAEDTTNAATALRTQKPDTMAGKKYTGSTATTLTPVTA